MRWRRLAVALVSAAAVCAACAIAFTPTGCTRQNPSYCERQSDCASGFCDVTKHECTPSGSCPATCPATTPVCDPSVGVCAKCKLGSSGDTFCAARDPSTPVCAPDGTCVAACTQSAQCPATEPICGTDGHCGACTKELPSGDVACQERDPSTPYCAMDGTCVACTDSSLCVDPAAPVCDSSSHTCRACQLDGECNSGVCDTGSGMCVSADKIIYVDGAGGSDGGKCGTAAAPCQTITQPGGALDKVTLKRWYVHLAPTATPYKENVHIDGTMLAKVTFVGPGATIQYPGYPMDSAFVDVGNGAQVTFHGVTITGATGANGSDIGCTGSGTALDLRGVTVENSALSGINASGCTVVIADSVVTDNGHDGVYLDDCDATITATHVTGSASIGVEATNGGSVHLARSMVQGNAGGGVSVTNTGFDIVNDVIRTNGNSKSSFGGVAINNSGIPMQTLAFNTVTENQADPGQPSFGVSCHAAGPALTADSNIVWGGSGPAAAISGGCMWTYSDVQKGGLGGSNIDQDPKFDPTDQYHLTMDSPCVDRGDPAAGVTVDYDGDKRPQGKAPDIGADEFVAAMAPRRGGP